MKFKFGVHATQTQSKEGFVVVEAHDEGEARQIADESDEWDWDDYNYPETVIDSVTQREPVEDDEEEDDKDEG